jgi:hypothetical protein
MPLTIVLASPCALNPAPIIPTRIGQPSYSRAWSRLSTIIIGPAPPPGRSSAAAILALTSGSISDSRGQARSFSEISPPAAAS